MRFIKPAVLLLVAVIASLTLIACGKGSPPPTINPLVISSRSLPVGVVNSGYSSQLQATGGVTPYTWSIISGSLPPGINLSAQGLVSGTPTATGSFSVTVQVTDSQTPTAAVTSSGFTLTVNNPLAITTSSLSVAAIGLPYQATVTASGGVPPYTWALVSGSLPDGLQLNPAGVISGTPTTQGTSTFTLQVSDAENPAVTAKQDFTLTVGGTLARLSGNFVFSFRGFSKGIPMVQAGSFVSDGNGTITSGTADIVSNSGAGNVHVNAPVHGSYTLDDTGRGTISLVFGNGMSGQYQLAAATGSGLSYFSFIQNGDGQATPAGSGLLKKQGTIPTNLAAFGTSTGAPWAFGGSGLDGAGKRYAAGGTFQLITNGDNTSGTLSNGLMDANDNGQMSIGKALNGSLALPDATTGRGTLSLGVSGPSGVVAYYYIGLSNGSLELVGVSADPLSISTSMVLYSLRKQNSLSGGYSNKAVQGATLSELSALPSPNAPDVSLAMLDFDGAGTGYAAIDENNAGTVTQNKFNVTYSVDSNGRTTFTGWNGPNPILYLWSFESGFVLGQDPGVTYGELEFQNVQSQSHSPSNADFTGAYSGGTVGPVVSSQTVEADTFSADGATPGNLTGTYDISGGGNPPQQGLPLAATYNVDTGCPALGTSAPTTCGRFPLLDSNNNQIGVGYLVNVFGPNRVVLLKTNTTQPVINILQK
jgi:hypothetical protein